MKQASIELMAPPDRNLARQMIKPRLKRHGRGWICQGAIGRAGMGPTFSTAYRSWMQRNGHPW